MKRLFILGLSVVFDQSLAFHANAMEFDSIDIFQTKGEKPFVRAHRTTGAHQLHAEHIAGETIGGKPLVVGIIDRSFFPKYTLPFKEKGLIHPDAFSENWIFDPADNFADIFLPHEQRKFKKECIGVIEPSYGQEEKEKMADLVADLTMAEFVNNVSSYMNTENRPDLEPFVKKTHYYGRFFSEDSCTHGSGVMEAFHAIAPKASILPIDLLGFGKGIIYDTEGGSLAWAIQTAIHYNVDVINLSISPGDLELPGMLKACKEATDKGIPIIIAAGNDSTGKQAKFINPADRVLFDAVDGHKILFVGALGYRRDGTEGVSDFTQHPTQKMEKNFICAAGSELPYNVSSLLPWSMGIPATGTSFSAPEVAGGYILLKQIAQMHNYPASSQELLDILYASGRNVSCTVSLPVDPDTEILTVDDMQQNKTYKSMDLVNAKKMLEEKIKATKPVSKNSGRPLPTIPVVKNSGRPLPTIPQASSSTVFKR